MKLYHVSYVTKVGELVRKTFATEKDVATWYLAQVVDAEDKYQDLQIIYGEEYSVFQIR